MSHHGYHHIANPEEMLVMNADVGRVDKVITRQSCGTRSKTVLQHRDPIEVVEERQETETGLPKPRNKNKISAMRLKFEKASANREQAPVKQRVLCGSPIAERKKQLQQLFVAREDASQGESTQTSSSNSHENGKAARRESGNASINSRESSRSSINSRESVTKTTKKLASKVSNRTKLFEQALRKHELQTELARIGPTKRLCYPEGSDPEETFTMTVSDSELSPLEYDGSLFSDDNTFARDEVEASRPTQLKDYRQMDDIQLSDQPGAISPTFCSSLSPNNSFQEALQEIVKSFEKNVNASEEQTARLFGGGFQQTESERESGRTRVFSSQRNYVMETNRVENPSPVSLLTSLESDPSGNMSSKGSSVIADDMPKRNDGFLAQRMISPKALSPSQVLPNSSLFSTVDQEEEKERTSEKSKAETDEQFNEGISDHPSEETDHPSEETSDYTPEGKSNTTTEVATTQATNNGTITSDLISDMPDETLTASPGSTRYKMCEKQDPNQPIKGILKNKQQSFINASASVSTSSWYSSTTSCAASEVSQQLSPMVHTRRVSVGACVNAHLAEENITGPAKGGCHHDNCQELAQGLEIPCCLERSSATEAKMAPLSKTEPPAGTRKRENNDLQELAEAMTNMANTASNAVLDVLVDAADKVVVTPLISIFNCVDASESIFCQGGGTSSDWKSDEPKVHKTMKLRTSKSPRPRQFSA